MNDIYEPKYVETLFDKMSTSYSKMNYITSFGFSERWRKQCVDEVSIKKGKTTVDLMTGMGECWAPILKNSDNTSKLIALDFSSEMIHEAEKKKLKYKEYNIEILKENIFNNSIPDNTADYVISGFGLKTFNNEQLEKLALEINRILKPGGTFSLVDVSVPYSKIITPFYMFYLQRIVPVIGKLFLGNPETYKMLGVYTEAFKNANTAYTIFNKMYFQVDKITYFFGCATGIKGRKKYKTKA